MHFSKLVIEPRSKHENSSTLRAHKKMWHLFGTSFLSTWKVEMIINPKVMAKFVCTGRYKFYNHLNFKTFRKRVQEKTPALSEYLSRFMISGVFLVFNLRILSQQVIPGSCKLSLSCILFFLLQFQWQF